MWMVKLTSLYDKSDSWILKKYPFKLQCIVWCYLKGYVTSGYADTYPYERFTFLTYWPAADGKLTIEEES